MLVMKHIQRVFALLAFVLFGSIEVQAQMNLIQNPSFENYNNCPNSLSDIPEAYWDKAPNHSGSSDYFNSCATVTSCDVPTNTFGTSTAATGVAYAGGYIGLQSGTYREYIFDTLGQTLVSGAKYVVSFAYRLASNARFAGDDMGFYLSSTPPTGTGTGTLGVTPTSQNASGNYLTNNTSWQIYSDTITAVGGEQYITIGAFNTSPAVILYNTSASIGGAYYWWDDVQLFLLEGIGGDTNICLGDSAQVYGIEIDSISWRDSLAPTVVISTQDTITVSPTVTTTYMAVVPGDTYYFTVNVIQPQSGFLGNDTIICEGETVYKAVDFPGYSYDWSDGGTDSLLITNDSGSFSLEISLYGCVSADTFHIAFHDFAAYDLGPDQTICWYDSTILDPNVQGTVDYTWSNGSHDPTLTVNTPGIYWVDMTDSNCTMRDSITISFHPTVVVDLGPDQEFCYSAGEALTPNALNASTFTWSTGTTGNTAVATTSGMYYVTATGNGCNAFDSVQYTFYYDPYFDLPETLMYCSDDTVTLSTGLDTTGLDFVWNIGTHEPTIQVFGGSQGNYWVQASGEHCSMRDTIYVGMHPPMNLELGNDLKRCEGDSVLIEPSTSSSISYQWSTGSNSQDLTVTTSGIYTLTVSNGFCEEVDNIRVFFYQYPVIDLGSDTTLCAPSELHFDIQSPWSAVTYEWYDGTITPDHVMFADEDATLWVRATNFVCTAVDSIHITLAAPPKVLLKNDTIICNQEMAHVRANGNPSWSYQWSNGDSTQTLRTNAGGVYSVTVNDGTCTSIDSVKVISVSDPTLEIFGPEYICIGDIEELDATIPSAYQYLWQNGSSNSILYVTDPGVYSVKVTHACGVVRDTITVKDCECFVRLPNAFRPSPSGVNQTFGAEVECDLNSFKLIIYNRWGEVLFQTENPQDRWNGMYNGKMVAFGSYAWVCEYKGLYDGEQIARREQGTVTVIP
jgi:gliding motility-associated-like protein